jgi:hypothetical protein
MGMFQFAGTKFINKFSFGILPANRGQVNELVYLSINNVP